MKDCSVLVTGATGFIGTYLVPALIAEGAIVTVVTRNKSRVPVQWRAKVKILEIDISRTIVKLPQDTEYVFHCAGSVRIPEEFESANITATAEMIEACKRLKNLRRFIHLSSVGVMGSKIAGVVDETTSCHPQNLYEKSKFKAECLALNANGEIPVTVLRPSTVFGPYSDEKQDPFMILLRAIRSRRFMLIGNGRSYFNLIYIEDVVNALICLAKTNNTQVEGNCYILNDPITWRAFTDFVTTKLGVRRVRSLPKFIVWPIAVFGSAIGILGIRFPITVIRYKGLTNRTNFDSGKITKDLGWVPTVGVDKGIHNMLDAYRGLY